MNEQLTPEIVDALVCELGKRPEGAPTIAEILGYVTGVRRSDDELVVTFEPTSEQQVRAVVEAERACCSTIGWRLDIERGLRLRIDGTLLQLDTLEAMFGQQTGS